MNSKGAVRTEEVAACALCGSNGVDLYAGLTDAAGTTPGNWRLVRCPECGLVWLNPRPVAADVARLYDGYYTYQAREQPPTGGGTPPSVACSVAGLGTVS
jgi:hypothetical protein